MAGLETATSYFPLPWATDPADHFLISAEGICSVLGECGFIVEFFEDASDTQLSGAPQVARQAQLSLSVYVDNLAQKGENAQRSLKEGQIRFVRGVFRTK